MIPFIQFTDPRSPYPMHTEGFSAVGSPSATTLQYTFCTPKAATAFVANLKAWSPHLPLCNLSKYASQPFEKASSPFPAAPDIASYHIVLEFSPNVHPFMPYLVSQLIGHLGTPQPAPAKERIIQPLPSRSRNPFLP